MHNWELYGNDTQERVVVSNTDSHKVWLRSGCYDNDSFLMLSSLDKKRGEYTNTILYSGPDALKLRDDTADKLIALFNCLNNKEG